MQEPFLRNFIKGFLKIQEYSICKLSIHMPNEVQKIGKAEFIFSEIMLIFV